MGIIHPALPFPEPLEARIAPANLLLPANALAIPGDQGAQGTGALGSVLLVKGDTLFLDVNSDGTMDAGDTALVSVTGGSALVFLADGNADVGWDADEITGLAVSDGFKGQIFTDVRGSITTSLTPAGAHGTTLQYAKILDLTVTGRVFGSILAGASIAKAQLGSDAADGLAVTDLLAGTAAHGFDASLGPTAQTFNFNQPAGKVGGSIANVTLTGGVERILASEGYSVSGGTCTAGGNVTGITITQAVDGELTIAAGGGGGGAGKAKAGAGGLVKGVSVDFGAAELTGLSIQGGAGGGTQNGTAKAGGAVSSVTITATLLSGALSIAGGEGGSSDTGKAAAGGALNSVTLNLASTTEDGNLELRGGEGGFARKGGAAGGAVLKTILQSSLLLEGDINLRGGDGGECQSGTAGAGGKISGLTMRVQDVTGAIAIRGGAGALADSGAPTPKGKGGAGGGVDKLDIQAVGDLADVTLAGGDGGAGDLAGGNGGTIGAHTVGAENIGMIEVTGGAGEEAGNGDGSSSGAGGGVLNGTWLIRHDILGNVLVQGGDADEGPKASKNGGSITNFTLRATGSAQDILFKGGDADFTLGKAGAGGSLKKITVEILQEAGSVLLTGGQGGDEADNPFFEKKGGGKAGAGGAISSASVVVKGTLAGGLEIMGGEGGNSDHAGGAGGAITGLTGSIAEADHLLIFAGGGGQGSTGGAGGGISKANFATGAITADLTIAAGFGGFAVRGKSGSGGGIMSNTFTFGEVTGLLQAGDSSPTFNGSGGSGGSLASNTIILTAEAALSFLAGRGGDAAGSGKGGTGGSVSKLSVLDLVGTGYAGLVHLIAAGNGGDSDKTAGAGGSVKTVTVEGNIGDFSAGTAFNFNDDLLGMGGLSAGLGGAGGTKDAANGSVNGVTAEAIAAIVAGRPDATSVTVFNAASSVTNIKTNVLGADNITPATFTFTDLGSPGFALADGDQPQDGLVIVKTRLGTVKKIDGTALTPLMVVTV